MARVCSGCEYFDRHYGDCHNSLSPRFQTLPNWTCDHWFADSTADITTIHVCAGPPQCALEGDAAVEAQKAGCVWCKRIIIDNDGRETEIGPGVA